ncbi:MAG: ATP-binding cassette domain-containing protein [Armatimonadota bacterium]
MTDNSRNVIHVSKLRKTFADVVALDGVDLEVREGEVFGLVGSDGAGKTTLIRILSGLLPAEAGDALVAGRDVVTEPESVKPHTGYLAQAFALYGDLTVEENVSFCARVYGVPADAYEERLTHLLRITRLAPFTDRLAEHLSGGMRQKLGLMCALIHRPDVLFLDEPTTGVDPGSRRDFWRLLHGLPDEGVTILVSTPYMDEAERCDRIALIEAGRILRCGTPTELRGEVTGSLFSLEATPQREARRALQDVPEVESVTVFGNRLHIAAREGMQREALAAALQRAGVEVASLEQIEPGLEDVFATAMREAGARVG